MAAAAVLQVPSRAKYRREYCHLPEGFSPLSFHVEHIVARQHGGSDNLENLALACPSCNLHKGPNLTGIDPDTGQVTSLFNPRTQAWEQHFKTDGPRIIGVTPEGRTTEWLLKFNAEDHVRWRSLLGSRD